MNVLFAIFIFIIVVSAVILFAFFCIVAPEKAGQILKKISRHNIEVNPFLPKSIDEKQLEIRPGFLIAFGILILMVICFILLQSILFN